MFASFYFSLSFLYFLLLIFLVFLVMLWFVLFISLWSIVYFVFFGIADWSRVYRRRIDSICLCDLDLLFRLNVFIFLMCVCILMRRIRILHSFSVVFLYWFYVFSWVNHLVSVPAFVIWISVYSTQFSNPNPLENTQFSHSSEVEKTVISLLKSLDFSRY